MEIIGYILVDVFIAGIGWLCLWVWYRNRKKVQQVRDEQFAGSYGAAGRIFILNLIAGAGAVTMIGIIIALVIHWVYEALMD